MSQQKAGNFIFLVQFHTSNWERTYAISFVFITGRNEVVAKVLFLVVSVILLTGGFAPLHGGIYHLPPPRPNQKPPGTKADPQRPKQTPNDQSWPPGTKADPPMTKADTPLLPPGPKADPGIRSMSGRYASYWNAFLFIIESNKLYCK